LAVSQEDLKRFTDRAFGGGKRCCDPKKVGRLRPAVGEPVSEGADCLLGAVDVAEAERIDDASTGSVQTDVSVGADVQFGEVDVEGHGVESVPSDRRCSSWLSHFTRKSDVDDGWDLIREFVSGESGRETQGGFGCADGDFEKVVVGVDSGLDEDPAAEVLDAFGVSPFVELAVGDAMGARVGMGEHERKFFDGRGHA
jgi:hypothetical protein